MLLADPKTDAFAFAEKIQGYLKERRDVEVPLLELEVSKFRNGELGMHVPENLRQKKVYFIQSPSKDPQQWWVELMLACDLIPNASAKSLSLVLPNMLYSRQDRKDQHHVPISARTVARTISHGTKRIITMDLHAGQIQGFYPNTLPVDNLYSFPELVRHLSQNYLSELESLAIVSPDAGGTKRARALLSKLERLEECETKFSFALIDKSRSGPGEIERMDLVGDVEGKNVLIVDDMYDSCGTMCSAGELIKEKGAEKLFCYATHGIFTKGTKRLKKTFDRVITSNTHYRDSNDVEVIDVSGMFAEAIYRATKGLSISKLFK